ncbi:asparagine synthase (glutamine-hydrolyzing) [bacterium]|nr:asparagine synthase (glutamine-hydrolyzing) [bacterium]
MCGIAGIVGGSNCAELLELLNQTQLHRGPDDGGTFYSPEARVGLAMRRLSILDIEGGGQPMFTPDETICIVFNGEIFNSLELRKELIGKGCEFSTKNSDTEVLLQLYLQKGVTMLDDLNGMFAFVIYDIKRNKLFGARDQMGIKPFYYWNEGGRMAFASELKSLLLLPQISRNLDHQSIFHYLSLLYIPAEKSAIDKVHRLPAGHAFELNVANHSFRSFRYWTPNFGNDTSISTNDWPPIIRTTLADAVKRWTLSDVPIACSLSGGIDSSAIVGLLSESGIGKVHTYSLGFSGSDTESFNETELARETAARFGTDHHEIILEPTELLDDLLQMVWHLDEPYAGGLPSWYVFRAMAQDVKVGLTGTGGDELFGNYGKYRAYENQIGNNGWNAPPDNLNRSILQSISRMTNHISSGIKIIGNGRSLYRKIQDQLEPFGRGYYAFKDYLSDELKRSIVLQQTASLKDTSTLFQDAFAATATNNLRDGLMAVDLRTQLPEEFLFMTDRLSMAHSLEARTPFLDRQLVDLVCRIPSSIRTKTKDPKYLLKKSVSDLLPPELLNKPKKGFVLPIKHWLCGPLAPLTKRLLNPDRLRKQGLFQPQFYERFVTPHLNQQKDYTWQIWAALMFQLWHHVFIDQKEKSAPSYSWKDLC